MADTKFSWLRIGKVIGVTVIIAAIAGGAYAAFTSREGKILMAGWTKGNREHFLPCEDLPFFSQVKRVLLDHDDTAKTIAAITGFKAEAREIKCRVIPQGAEYIKGDIVFKYGSSAERGQIEERIGDNFFGIPWAGKRAE